MSIKVQIICIFTAMLALLSAIIVSMGFDSVAQQRIADAQLNRFQSNKLADQLRQSSDDLTRMARTYAVTGDPIYEQYYFDILAIRDGTAPRPQDYHEIYWDLVTSNSERHASPGRPAALMDLFTLIGLSGEELSKLEEAKNNSDALTNLEKTAFGAMKGLFADDLGNLTVRREPDPEFAREILHDGKYHQAKAEIMRPIGEFMKLVDERIHRELKDVQTQEIVYRIAVSALTVSAFLFSGFAFFHVKRRVVDPVVSLASTAQRIEQGNLEERATVSSSDELGTLYSAFNSMVDRIRDTTRKLENEIAERKRAEAVLKEQTELVQLLHRLAAAANEAGDVKEAIQTFLDEVCAHTGWPIGHGYRLSADQPNTLVSSNIWHLDDPKRFSTFLEVTEKTDFEFGFGLPGRVLASGKPAWIVDVTKDPNFPRASLAEDIGVRTGFALPVLVGAEVTGVLEFFTSDVVKPDNALLQVLTSIGTALGRVIERKRAEDEIAHMADHDTLTGLPSLRLGMDRAQAAVARAHRNKTMAALLFIDLDGFKAVNDTLGHEAGDHVLKGVAERLLASIRETDSAARIGGDEFIVVLTDLNELAAAASVARKLIDALREPFRYNGQDAVIGASVGIAVYPEHGITTEELLKRADEAMYAVKHKGKNDYQFAQESLENAAPGETGTDEIS